jgi:hypothetical protein
MSSTESNLVDYFLVLPPLATKITDRTNLPISVFPVMFWEGINVLLWYAIHELWRGLWTLAERPAPRLLSIS